MTIYFEKDSDSQRLLHINGMAVTMDEAKNLRWIEDYYSIFGHGVMGFRFIKPVLSADVEEYRFTIQGGE